MALYTNPGSEFLVNTKFESAQGDPDVTALSDGKYVVVWRTNNPGDGDGNGTAIKGQVYNADGTKYGTEILINSDASDDQEFPRIAALEDGKFAVTWEHETFDAGNDASIMVRVFTATGAEYTAEQQVNTYFTGEQIDPDIAKLADGGFVVTWTTKFSTAPGGDGSGYAVKAQRFDVAGNKIGSEFQVNSGAVQHQSESSVTGLSDGKFVVAWKTTDINADGNAYAIMARIFNADGTPYSAQDFVVGQVIAGSPSQPSIAALGNGKFVVAFKTPDDGSSTGIGARIFNADGSPYGDDIMVNQLTGSDQKNPQIEAVGKNWFAVTWESYDSGNYEIKARLFNNNGTPAGDEFLVNQQSSGTQELPAIAFLPDGRLVVVWETSDASQDTSSNAIKGVVIDITNLQIGDDGKNTLTGTDKEDYLYAEGGNDKVNGGDGNDIMRGGDGNDKMKGGNNNDRMYGDDGKDKMFGDKGKDTMYGGDQNDKLKGGKQNDKLYGDKGKDKLNGDKGNDRLDGGANNDKFTGGEGKDTFVFVKNGSDSKGKGKKAKYKGYDKVTDYEDGKDKIDLKDFKFKDKNKALKYFNEVGTTSDDQLEFVYKGQKVLIKGADLADIDASDLLI